MSVSVQIKQKKLFKKKLDIAEIVQLTHLAYGVCDEHFRLVENEIGEHTLIFDKQKLARGIDLSIEGKSLNLFLNLPTSKEEIRCFYKIIETICAYLGVEEYIREGGYATMADTDVLIRSDEQGSIQGLKDLQEKIESEEYSGVQLMGIYNPISIGKKEIKRINSDLDNLSDFLHELQSMDVYYAVPHIYEVKDRLVGIYAIGADISSVVPTKPHVIFNDSLNVEEWFVILQDGNTIKYDDFLKNAGRKKYYDDNHIIVKLSEKKIDELISKYYIEV